MSIIRFILILFISSILYTINAQEELVSQWGFIGGRTGGWNLKTGDPGSVTISGNIPNNSWSAVRGGFSTLNPSADSAILITGKIEFTGGGFEGRSGLRYGLFYSDSAGIITNDTTVDSNLVWSGTELYHSGYLFTPVSGDNEPAFWPDGFGTFGVVKNGCWLSTIPNSRLIENNPAGPKNAVASSGIYDFAISVQPVTGGTNLRFYLIKEDESYYFLGSSLDTFNISPGFNSVCFAINSWEGSATTAMKLKDVKVTLGDPIPVPNTCFCPADYIAKWGFSGGRIGSWKFIPGEFIGNVSISREIADSGWSAIRGEFPWLLNPEYKVSVIQGRIDFIGGGFENPESFRLGVFYSDSAGQIISLPVDSTRWSGSENHHSGYLFIPVSGNNNLPFWEGINQTGTWGSIKNDTWLNTDSPQSFILGTDKQHPEGAIGSEGSYEFAISIGINNDGTAHIRFLLGKDDMSYYFNLNGDDTHPLPAEKFNSIEFAFKSTTATLINIYDVLTTVEEPLSSNLPGEGLPGNFSLSQNYPNPFNPATTIKYFIPEPGFVSLRVYNMLGEEIAALFEGFRQSGKHSAVFDAKNLSSGVYLYRLKADNYTETKKLLLLK